MTARCLHAASQLATALLAFQSLITHTPSFAVSMINVHIPAGAGSACWTGVCMNEPCESTWCRQAAEGHLPNICASVYRHH